MRDPLPWAAADLDLLRALFADTATAELAARLGRTYAAVAQRAARLGLKKSAAYLASPAAGRLDGTQTRGRFPRGNRPWNQGRPFVAGGRSTQTQFKPGQAPKNTLPIGSYRLTKDGILQQKISDRPGPCNRRWTAVHRLVWEAAHGPIPRGCVVVFKRGRHTTDPAAITLDALELASRADLMARNSVHNLPPELVELVRLRGVLTRRINERSTP